MGQETPGPKPEELGTKTLEKSIPPKESLAEKRQRVNETHLLGLIEATKREGTTKEDLESIKAQAHQMKALIPERDEQGKEYFLPSTRYPHSEELLRNLQEAEKHLGKSSKEKETRKPIEQVQKKEIELAEEEKLKKTPEASEELKNKFDELMEGLEKTWISEKKDDLYNVKQEAVKIGLFQTGNEINKTKEAKRFYDYYNEAKEKLYGKPRIKIAIEEAKERNIGYQREKKEKREKKQERKAKKQEQKSAWQEKLEKLAKLQEELKNNKEK